MNLGIWIENGRSFGWHKEYSTDIVYMSEKISTQLSFTAKAYLQSWWLMHGQPVTKISYCGFKTIWQIYGQIFTIDGSIFLKEMILQLILISKKKNLLGTDRACFQTNSIRSLRPVLPDRLWLLSLSSLASGAAGRPTLPPQPAMGLLPPYPLLVPPPSIRPLNLSSSVGCGAGRGRF